MRTEFKVISLTLIVLLGIGSSLAFGEAAYHYHEYEGFKVNLKESKTVDLPPEDLPSHVLCSSVCSFEENCGYFTLEPSDPKKCILIQPVSSSFITTSDPNDKLLLYIKYPTAFKESRNWFKSRPNPMLRVRVFTQHVPYLFIKKEVNFNKDDPTKKKYSILGFLSDVCQNPITEKFYFYLCYPEFAQNPNATHRFCSSWYQTSNPFDYVETVIGFQKVSYIFGDKPPFGGLAKSIQGFSHLDGDFTVGWHYAVGAYSGHRIPFMYGKSTSMTELYCIAEPVNLILFQRKHGLPLDITNIS